MKLRALFIGLLLVIVLGMAVVYAAEPRYEISVVDQWDGIPTQAVIASRSSMEQALYNWVFVNEIFWNGMTRNERQDIISKALRFNGTGLGVKVRLPKTNGLKGVEIALIPFNNGRDSIIVVCANLRQKTKGGWENTKFNNGLFWMFRLEKEHLIANFIFDNTEILKKADELIAQKPEDPERWMNKAYIYDFSDQRKAIEEYEGVIKRFPEYAGAYNNLAMIYTGYSNLNLLNPDKAVEYALKACELTKNEDIGHLDTLARAYYAQGEREKAMELTRANILKKDEIVYHAFLEWMECNNSK